MGHRHVVRRELSPSLSHRRPPSSSRPLPSPPALSRAHNNYDCNYDYYCDYYSTTTTTTTTTTARTNYDCNYDYYCDYYCDCCYDQART